MLLPRACCLAPHPLHSFALVCCCCYKQTAYVTAVSSSASICMSVCICSVVTSFLFDAYCYMQYAYSILPCATLLFFVSGVRLSHFVVCVLLIAVHTYFLFSSLLSSPHHPFTAAPLHCLSLLLYLCSSKNK